MRAFLLIPLLPSLVLAAQPEPWVEPFTEDTKSIVSAANAAARTEDPLTIVLKEMELRYDESGVETERMRWVFRVETDDAAKEYAGFDVSWDPGLEEVPEFRVRVIQPDGSAQELDPKTAIEASPGADDERVYRERKGLRAPLPNVRKGSIIEQQIITRARPSLFQKGAVKAFALAGPIVKARLIVTAPAALPLKLVVAGSKEQPPAIQRAGGQQRAVGEWRDVAEVGAHDAYQPLDAIDTPALYVSTGASWKVLAKDYSEIVDGKIKTNAQLPAEALAAAASAKDPLSKARALTGWLHEHVRYTGLYFGEGTVIPTAPAETLRRGFGDCKDMSTLLVALLRASGVKANVALLQARGDDLERRAPGLGMLDHAIVYVPGPKPFFVDPTDTSYQAGANIPYLAGRTTVVADPSLADPLIKIPESTSADNGWEIIRDVYPAELNSGSYASESRYRGSFVESTGWMDAKPEDFEPSLLRLVKAHFGCKAAEAPSRTERDGVAVVSFKGTGCEKIASDDTEAAALIPLTTPLYDAPKFLFGTKDEESGEARPAREQPLRWPVPFSTRAVYRVHTPFGFRPLAASEKREWKFGAAKFTREVAVTADLVTITAAFDSGPRVHSAAEVEAFRAEVDKSGDSLDYVVKFERIAAAEVAAGHVKEGLAAYRAAIAAHPNEAAHRVQYASMLLQLGFSSEARRQAALAVKLEPSWGIGHRASGWILQFDEVGRRFLKGWDRKGSIAALREAVRLSPEDSVALRALARSLLHNEIGTAFGPESIDEAITFLRQARKVQRNDSEDVLLLVTLFRAGKYAECQSLFEEFSESEGSTEIGVACILAEKGLKAGAAEFEKRIAAAKRGGLATRIAADLLLVRQYDTARALRERYPGDGAEQTSSAQLKLLSRLKRSDSVAVTANDPASAVKRMFLSFIGGEELKPEKFFASAVAAEMKSDPAAMSQMSRIVDDGIQVMERSGMPRAVYKDIIVSAADMVAEVEARHASARVEVTLLDQPRIVFFLVKEKSGWVVRAAPGQREELAAEAAARIAKGDVAGARLWLKWAMAQQATMTAETERARAATWSNVDGLDAHGLKLLAATFLVDRKARRAEGLALIDAEKTLTAAEQAAVDWAVADAMSWSRAPAEAGRALAAAARLLQDNPSSVTIEVMRLTALGRSGDTQAMWTGVDAMAARYANDSETLGDLSSIADGFGDAARTRKLREAEIKTGRASSATYNNLAWSLLLEGEANLKVAEEHARKAEQLSKAPGYPLLNTLAAIHAEAGRGKSAYQYVIRSLRAGKVPYEPRRQEWYVMGRIAESYGLDDVARDLYLRARSADTESRDDITTLSDRRLAKVPKAAVSTETPP